MAVEAVKPKHSALLATWQSSVKFLSLHDFLLRSRVATWFRITHLPQSDELTSFRSIPS